MRGSGYVNGWVEVCVRGTMVGDGRGVRGCAWMIVVTVCRYNHEVSHICVTREDL